MSHPDGWPPRYFHIGLEIPHFPYAGLAPLDGRNRRIAEDIIRDNAVIERLAAEEPQEPAADVPPAVLDATELLIVYALTKQLGEAGARRHYSELSPERRDDVLGEMLQAALAEMGIVDA